MALARPGNSLLPSENIKRADGPSASMSSPTRRGRGIFLGGASADLLANNCARIETWPSSGNEIECYCMEILNSWRSMCILGSLFYPSTLSVYSENLLTF